jgi:SAM-dependent methyltransferase
MLPQRLYDLQAAASGRPDPATAANRRDEDIAVWSKRFLERRQKDRGDLVEIAVGDAGLSFALARILPHARIRGFDIAAARVESAKSASRSLGLDHRMTFNVLDAERDLGEIADHSADALFAIDLLEHLFDVFAFCEHVARILRPGGLAVFRVPNIAYVRHRISLALGRLPVTASWFGPENDLAAWRSTWGWDGGHLHYFTRSTLASLLTDVGLRPVDWRDPGTRFERARRRVPDLLVGNLCVFAERDP